MKKNIRYWLLIFLATTSLNLFGQDPILNFKKPGGYKDFISLKDFIEEINRDNAFKLKLRDTVLSKYNIESTGDNFTIEAGDEKVKLEFLTKEIKKNTVSRISIGTILKELQKNPKFNNKLIIRLTPTSINDKKTDTVEQKIVAKNGVKKVDVTQQTLAENILLVLNKNKGAQLVVIEELNKNNFILNYWWIICLLCIAFFTLSAWYLSIFIYKKTFFNAHNKTFFSDKPKTLLNQHDIIDKLEVKSNIPQEGESEKTKILQDALEAKEKELQKWVGLARGKSIETFERFLQDKGFYSASQEPESNTTYIQESEPEKGDVFYFSSVNRDGDLGVFQDENKTSYKESDSIYKFEIKKSNRNEAEFWYDATNPAYALSYRSYIIDPFCNSQTPFQESNTRIIHEKKGTASLDGNRWIVTKKAEIKYK